MNKIKDTLRFIFISPEFLFGLAVYVGLSNFPEGIDFIKKIILSNKKEWFAGFSLTFIFFNYKYTESILNPKNDDNRKTLKEFSGYWKLKNRLYYSVYLSITCFLISLFSLYYYLDKDISNAIILLLITYTISFTSSFTIAKADLDLKDILY